MENVNINSTRNVAMQKHQQRKLKINWLNVFKASMIVLGVLAFVVANIYSNRWGRNVTQLDHQIQILETKLEKAKVINQELSSKSRLEKKAKGGINMHYSSSNVVVVSEFK